MSKNFIFSTLGINSVLGLADRVAQITYYCWTDFVDNTVRDTALTFCVLPSGINFFIIFVYTLFHNETMWTPKVKLRNFFLYLFSSEALFPIGMQISFQTKYSENADSILLTMKVLNALHIMFVSLPQLLIISIHSSAIDKFDGIDITSLILSVIFIIWSVAYFWICSSKEDDYEGILGDMAKLD